MFRFTERMLCILALVALTAVPTLGETITENFESYTPTSSWLPTYPATDWGYGANSPLEITATGGYAGSQGLAMTSSGWPQQAYWYQTADTTATPNITLSYDFILAGTTSIYSRNGLCTTSGGNPAMLNTGSVSGGAAEFFLLTGGDTVTYLPGQDTATTGVWYTAEMEHDFDTGKARGRFGPVGGTMNDWTDWCDFYATTGALESVIFQQGHGDGTTLDNIKLTSIPEPTTCALVLSALPTLLAYARRRRK